jgi:D-sedoheptulose 7-phosphate isomerase
VAESAKQAFAALSALLDRSVDQHAGTIDAIASRFTDTLRNGGTLYFAGNGGSAADAQHCAAEYVVRYSHALPARRAFAAVALGTDPAMLTAAGNDLGFEQAYARQVEALVTKRDLLVLHSTSGRSPNLLAAARVARAQGAAIIALLGRDGGPLRELADLALVVDHDDTGRIQLVHMAVQHVIVGIVESRLAQSAGGGTATA